MKVFLSWSGKVSQDVAIALRKWLPYFHHSIKPFISTVDIGAGNKWDDDLLRELNEAQYGIVCVTPFNIHKVWMNFEAGSLSHRPHLVPFLFRVSRAALADSPLAHFQFIVFSADSDQKSEFYKLIDGINRDLAEPERLAPEVLEANFDCWWLQLMKDLQNIPDASVGETRTAYRWLRTFEELGAVHNLEPECTAVWFVTSDVFKYIPRSGAPAGIEANLDGAQYRYLIPEPGGGDERAALTQLAHIKQAHPTRVDYRCFKRDVFEKQATSDYVILESNASENQIVKVFVRIPIAESDSEYWFETEERAASGFYHRFLQLWNSPTAIVQVPAE